MEQEKKLEGTANVRVELAVLARIKAYAQRSGIKIGKFYDIAAEKELNRIEASANRRKKAK